MAIAFAQAWGGALPNNGTHGELVSSLTTGNLTTTAGNFIIAGVTYSATLSSFQDSKSNTWTTGVGPIANGGDSNIQKYAYNITGGSSHTLTANLPAGSYCAICGVEYSGLTTTDPLDKSNTGTGSSASLTTTATATTSQADELLIGSGTQNLSGADNVWTAGASFTKRSEINFGATTSVCYVEERIVAATGAYSAPMTSSVSSAWAADIATYKAAGGAAATFGPIVNGGSILKGGLVNGGRILA